MNHRKILVASAVVVASLLVSFSSFADTKHPVTKTASVPVLISAPSPEFPESARKVGIGAKVLVNLSVSEDGTPSNVRVIRIIYIDIKGSDRDPPADQSIAKGFQKNAVDAVKQYKFKPAMQGGNPVQFMLNVEVKFQIF